MRRLYQNTQAEGHCRPVTRLLSLRPPGSMGETEFRERNMAKSNEQGASAKSDPLSQTTGDVPTFSLVVHVIRRGDETEVRAANLAGFSCRAGDERAALQKLLPQIKQRVSECLARNESIGWLDPPLERQADEQQRVLPFHL